MGWYIAGEGEFENDGREPRGRGKEPKNFWKTFLKRKMFFERICTRRGEFENGVCESPGPKYVVNVCRPCAILVQLSSMLLALGHLVKTTTVSDGRLCVCVYVVTT